MTSSNSMLVALVALVLLASLAWDTTNYNMTVDQVSNYIATQGQSQLYGPAF